MPLRCKGRSRAVPETYSFSISRPIARTFLVPIFSILYLIYVLSFVLKCFVVLYSE